MVDSLDALPITLAGLGIFTSPSPTVWAAPAACATLIARQGRLIEALSQLEVAPHYRVGAWVPHITLCHQPEALTPHAIAAAVTAWDGPIEGSLDVAELVRFSPVAVLRSVRLGAP